MKKRNSIGAAVLIIFMFVLASGMDMEDQVQQQSYYCDSVDDGTHPDYREVYDEVC
jgi:hypothetical protein